MFLPAPPTISAFIVNLSVLPSFTTIGANLKVTYLSEIEATLEISFPSNDNVKLANSEEGLTVPSIFKVTSETVTSSLVAALAGLAVAEVLPVFKILNLFKSACVAPNLGVATVPSACKATTVVSTALTSC